jgi:hypothetical protein
MHIAAADIAAETWGGYRYTYGSWYFEQYRLFLGLVSLI